jgi:hypothetical protein
METVMVHNIVTKFSKLSMKANYIKEKTSVVKNCEQLYFKLSSDAERATDWDSKQKYLDERYKLIISCMKKLGSIDKELLGKVVNK